MARTYFCASCPWKRQQKTDPGQCPDCGGLTQRYLTNWDHTVGDLMNFVGFVAISSSTVFLWVWFAYPYEGPERSHDFTVRFHLSSVSLIDSPNGSIARFSLRNDSRWEIAQTEVSVKIHALSRDQARMSVVAGPKTIIVKNLGTNTEQFFDVPVEGINGGQLFGWSRRNNLVTVRSPGREVLRLATHI